MSIYRNQARNQEGRINILYDKVASLEENGTVVSPSNASAVIHRTLGSSGDFKTLSEIKEWIRSSAFPSGATIEITVQAETHYITDSDIETTENMGTSCFDVRGPISLKFIGENVSTTLFEFNVTSAPDNLFTVSGGARVDIGTITFDGGITNNHAIRFINITNNGRAGFLNLLLNNFHSIAKLDVYSYLGIGFVWIDIKGTLSPGNMFEAQHNSLIAIDGQFSIVSEQIIPYVFHLTLAADLFINSIGIPNALVFKNIANIFYVYEGGHIYLGKSFNVVFEDIDIVFDIDTSTDYNFDTYIKVHAETTSSWILNNVNMLHDIEPNIIYRNGAYLQLGNTALVYNDKRGDTSERPTSPTTGFDYFDTDLNRPIWYNGSAWVDATGTSV